MDKTTGDLTISDISNEKAYNLVATMKYELEGLLDTEPVEGHAAEDEIRETVDSFRCIRSRSRKCYAE